MRIDTTKDFAKLLTETSLETVTADIGDDAFQVFIDFVPKVVLAIMALGPVPALATIMAVVYRQGYVTGVADAEVAALEELAGKSQGEGA